MYEKVCENCGKPFITDKSNKRFCCRNCKNKNKNKRIRKWIRYDNVEYTTECKICGKTFTTKYSDKIYCDDCKQEVKKLQDKRFRDNNKGYYKKYYQENKDKYKGKYKYSYEHKCLQCGITFESISRNTKYCPKCRTNIEYTVTCIDCGKTFKSNSPMVKRCEDCKQYKHKSYTLVCKICGNTFEGNNPNCCYCSEDCRKKANCIQSKTYRDSPRTREKYKANKREYDKRMRKNNVDYKLRQYIIPSIIRRCINSKSKTQSSLKYVDYSPQDLKQHLEKQFVGDMSWENHGVLWHVDHIRPLASYTFINEDGSINYDNIKEANSLENLRPLLAEENKDKSSWYNDKFYVKGVVVRER